jgi:predicted nucleotide-binding protein (sugar kinase/HSP70/actin superfamily)
MMGVESMTAETCFPVKVLHGHVKHLLDLADYIFLPNIINAPTPNPGEHGQFCPFVGSSQYIVKAALGISESRLIKPTLFLKGSLEEITGSFRSSLPKGRKPSWAAVASALERSWQKYHLFRGRMKERGESLLEETPEEEPVWIVTGRSYNLYDERCNLRLGKHLAKLGIRAVPMDFLELDRENLDDFPNMYWGSGSRILRAARRISRTPNFHGVHLTNFACGVDSFLEHFYRQIMGEKPSLILELDEHSAAAGLLTRLEAYRNVVRNLQIRNRPPIRAGT